MWQGSDIVINSSSYTIAIDAKGNIFSPPCQFRKGFKKMVLGLGCTITGKKPQDMTIEGYLRQVQVICCINNTSNDLALSPQIKLLA